MWGAIKWIALLGTGAGVLVFLAMEFQPGKNAKGGLNTNNSQPIADRFLKPDEVGPLGTTRLEQHDGKLYRVTYKPGYGRVSR